MNRKTVVTLFALGWAVGIPMSALYILFSVSHDRVFHGFVILAACGVSFPSVAIFLNITLKMWDKALEQSEVLQDLRNEIKPLVGEAKGVIKSVQNMMNQVGDQPKIFIDFIDKLAKDGTVEKWTASIEAVVKKVHDVIEQGRPASGGTREDLLKEAGGHGDGDRKAGVL